MSKKMFDFCIGNPPFDVTLTTQKSETNGQAPRKNVFHYFQMSVDKIAREGSVLIYPGGRWMQRSGKGLDEFGKNLLNDSNLSNLYFYPNSSDVFPSVALSDGISIVSKSYNKKHEKIQYHYICDGKVKNLLVSHPGDNLLPVNPIDIALSEKIRIFVKKYNLNYVNERIQPRTLFGIESDFVSKHPGLLKRCEKNTTVDDDKIKVFTNDKAGKAGRACWFVGSKSLFKKSEAFFNKWKVVVSSANAGGQKRDNQLEILDNHSIFGRSRVALSLFDTKEEAKNFYLYMQSNIARYTFLLTDEALKTLGKMVPDLIDYTAKNKLVDFSKDIDDQLFKLIGFSEEEKQNLLARVKESSKAKGGK